MHFVLSPVSTVYHIRISNGCHFFFLIVEMPQDLTDTGAGGYNYVTLRPIVNPQAACLYFIKYRSL